MADQIVQQLGLDASQAIQALRQLTATFARYARSVQASTAANAAFTKSGRGLLEALGADVAAIVDTVRALSDLEKAQNRAAAAAQKVADAERAAAQRRATQGRATQLQKGLGGLTTGITGENLNRANQLVQKISQIGARANLSAKAVTAIGNNLNRSLVGPQAQIQRLLIQLNRLRTLPPPANPVQGMTGGFLGAVTAANLLSNAISRLTNGIIQGTKDAIEYELTLARISTIAGPTGGTIEQLGTNVRALSDEFGRPILDVAQGQYELLSNQIGNAAEATNVLTAALKLSNVTGATSAQSVNAISSVINSYNLSTAEAEEISAKLFRAVDLGRFTLAEVADSMGRVTVTAAQLGVSFDEVLAGLATLTITGVPADEAMTLLSNTMRGLLKPTESTNEAFRRVGVTTAEAGIQAFGLLGFLEKLTEAGGDTASEITQMTENIRVARGVLGLTGDQADRAAASLQSIKDASADLLNQKNEIVVNTNAKQVQDELNRIANILIVDIGQNGLAGLNSLLKPIGGLTAILKGGAIALVAYGGGLAIVKVEALLAAGSVATMTTSLGAFSIGVLTAARNIGVFIASLAPIALPVAALSASVYLLGTQLQRTTDGFADYANELNRVGAAEAKLTATQTKGRVDREKDNIQKRASDLQKYLATLQAANNTELSTVLGTQQRIQAAFQDQITTRVRAYEQYVNAVRDAEKRAEDIAKASFERVANLTRSVDANRFERNLQAAPGGEAGQIVQRLQRVNSLLNQATDLERQGTEEARERAQSIREEAGAMAETAANSAAQLGNRALLKRAEDEINNVLNRQVEAENRRNAAARQAANTAKAQAAQDEKNLSEIKAIEEQIRKLQDQALQPSRTNEERLKFLQQTLPLASEIEAKLRQAGNTDLAKSLDIENLLRDVRKPFLDQLGKDVKLEVAFDNARAQLQRELNKEAFVAQVRLVAGPLSQASGLNVNEIVSGGGDLSKVQSAIADRSKSIEDGLNAQVELTNQQESLAASTRAVTAALASYRAQSQAAAVGVRENSGILGQAGQRLGSAVTEISTLVGRVPSQLQAEAVKFGQVQKSISDALAALKNDPNADISGTVGAINELARAEGAAGRSQSQKFLVDLGLALGDVATKTRELTAAQATVATGNQQAAALKAATDALRPQIQALTDAEAKQKALSTAATNGITSTNNAAAADRNRATAAAAAASGINAQAAAQERLNAANGGGGTAPSGAAVPRMFGGPIYRADGGSVPASMFKPRGTDTIPAMLSPGEFVVNAASTRKFYSQLTAMNAGRQPIYRAEGGPSTTISVGDVNVSSGGGDGNVIGRDIVKTLQREFRIRGSKFNRR